MDTKIFGNLIECHTRLTATRDAAYIITELSGIRPTHDNIRSGRTTGQANSDITQPCSRPTRCATGNTVPTTVPEHSFSISDEVICEIPARATGSA